MPYGVSKPAACPISKPFGVVRDDGTVVPGGCHPTRAKALDHQQALMVNVPDAQKKTRAPSARASAQLQAEVATKTGGGDPHLTTAELRAAFGDEKARTFNGKQRKFAVKIGAALPDGSFPIFSKSDLSNAIQSIGRASDQAAAKRHIIKRARALGLVSLLPKGWA